jgi:hypothetical protein
MNSLMSNTNREQAFGFRAGGLARSRQFRVWNFGLGRKEQGMARKYSKSASKDVESAMKKRKKGTLRSGKGGKGGKVKSRKQAIAIGLSEARKEGKKVPKKTPGGRKKS